MTRGPVPHDHDDRPDAAFDAVLRRTLAGATPRVGGGDCPDDETLGAWFDRTLPTAATQEVEAHVAGCARCQAIATVFVRTAVAADPAPRFWFSWRVRWLVPAAAVAAALLLWIALPGRPDAPVLETVTSRAERAAGSALAEPPASARPPEPIPAPDAPVGARDTLPAVTASEGVERAPASFPGASAPPAMPAAAERADGLPKAAAPAPGAVAPSENRAARAELASPTATRAAGAPAALANPAGSVPTPGASAGALSAERGAVARSAAAADAAPGDAIVSADTPASRWRIVDRRRVERSTDGGRSWQPAALAAPADLIAGASPAAGVCWVVGRGGLVFVTTDGLTFRRLTVPTSADVTAVRAPDARTAVVTTADGRTFRTADLGITWSAAVP
mgnify:CR=1 FL=1